jgi:hydrogenase maturation protein HypF
MELEWAIAGTLSDERYLFSIADCRLPIAGNSESGIGQNRAIRRFPLIIDWEPMVVQIIKEVESEVTTAMIAAKFHNTLSAMIVDVAKRVGEKRVVLSGGCFQNKYLTERTVRLLEENGFHPYWHQRVPPNDGGIALGQAYAAQESMRTEFKEISESVLTESLT